MRRLTAYLLAFVMAFAGPTYVFATSNINDLKKQQNEIKNNAAQAKDKLSQTQAEKSEMLAEVELLDAELTALTDTLNMISAELEETTIKLEETQVELADAETLREVQYETLKQRIRFMYESGQTGYLEILFASKSFADFLNRLEYINRIYENDKNILDKYAATETLINQKIEEISYQKREKEVLLDQYNKKAVLLEEALVNKEARVLELSSNEDKFMQLVKDNEDAEKEIQALIKKAEEEARKKAEEEARKKAEEEARKKATAAAASSSSVAKTAYYKGGKLAVPIQGSYTRTSPYGYRTNPFDKKTTEMHTGVDMAAPTGTNIVAAESGVVIFSGVKSGYGNTVIIDHGGTLTTLYAHCSKLLVKVGEEVKRGQVIAKVGSTGYSTGPHLHFETRINGNHTNPDKYLN